MASQFDRESEDASNILHLEHLNLRVPDLELASKFYVGALGLTRDPFIEFGHRLIWVNAGREQFHIVLGEVADVLRGEINLKTSSLDQLRKSLAAYAVEFEGTGFTFLDGQGNVTVTGPWGNRFRFTEDPGRPGGRALSGVTFRVPRGASPGIASFYELVMGCCVTSATESCEVRIGVSQTLKFEETEEVIPEYDKHHLAVYVADFSGPYRRLLDRGLIVEESDQHQYRFNWIYDPETGERLFEIEHEVRSFGHPLRSRPLINRNAEQTQPDYVTGQDAHWPA